MNEVLVTASHVSKKFCRNFSKSLWYGLHDMCREVIGGGMAELPLRADEFWAVRGVSFEVRRGECVGLIGRNGAGKTTLLRILNGLIKPDGGVVRLRGKIGALIALGSGFNPILTGRENIYANAAVLGFTKREIDKSIDSMIDFAEIGDAIDSPVQTYSSGMQVRLGFAVATALQPDILLLDEVLAVGDERFQLKCFERVGQLLQQGVAGILVSHQLINIERLCSRCIVMADGTVQVDTANIGSAIQQYHTLNEADFSASQIFAAPHSPVTIRTVHIDDARGLVTLELDRRADAPTKVLVSYSVRYGGATLLQGTTQQLPEALISIEGHELTITIPAELRRLGNLSLSVSLWNSPSSPRPLAWAKNINLRGEPSQPYVLLCEATTAASLDSRPARRLTQGPHT